MERLSVQGTGKKILEKAGLRKCFAVIGAIALLEASAIRQNKKACRICK